MLVFLSIVASLFEVLSLGLIIPVITSVITKNSNSNYTKFFDSFIDNLDLNFFIIALGVSFLFKNLYFIFLTKFQAKFVFDFEHRVSVSLFSRHLYDDYIHFLERSSSSLIRSIIGLVSNFSHNILATTCNLVAEIFVLIGIVSLLIYINPLAAFISFVGLIVIVGSIYVLFREKIARYGRRHHESEILRIKSIQEIFGAIKEIKTTGSESFFVDDFSFFTRQSCSSGELQQTIQVVPRLAIEFTVVCTILGVVTINLNSDLNYLLPLLALYAAAAFRIIPSANRIINSMQAIRYNQHCIPEITGFLKSMKVKDFKNTNKIAFKEAITFEKVTFSYEGRKPKVVLDNVSIKFYKGDFVCVVGPSGAGKSTLIDLFCGLLKPTSGKVMIDNIELTGKEEVWCKEISYVPQTVSLLDSSIFRNITFLESSGHEDLKLRTILDLCHLDEVVGSEEGVSRGAGERGVKLSGGQKQRIGIARALYQDKDVIVLDEATSALDKKTEKSIISNLLKITKSQRKTIIWITHNTSLLNLADKVIEVKNSKVLIKAGGL